MKIIDPKETIEIFKKVHNNKYSYDKVPDNFKISEKITIVCPVHGDFQKIAYNHREGSGCHYCLGRDGAKYDKIVNLLKENYGDSIKLLTSREDVIGRNKFEFHCDVHGTITQNMTNVYEGKVCGKCLIDNKKKSYNRVESEEFLKIKDQFEYINLPDTIGWYTNITVRCKKHNEVFDIEYGNHLRYKSHGCPLCIKQNKKSLTYSLEEKIKMFKDVHGDKYNYDKVVDCKFTEKIIITCPTHGDFLQSAKVHSDGSGCQKCAMQSSGEKMIQRWLTRMGLSFVVQKKFYGCVNKGTEAFLPFDIYVPEYHTCIEYDGHQHFMPVEGWGGVQGFEKIKERDKIKNEYCKNNDIELIRIPYTMPRPEMMELLSKHFGKPIVVPDKIKTKWIESNIKEKVQQYNSKSELRRKDNRLYRYCLKNKIIHDVCSFMKPKRVMKHTYENAKEVAKKYTSHSLFVKENVGLYQFIRANKYDHLVKHMSKKVLKYSEQEIIEEMKKYEYKTQFRIANPGMYNAAVNNGLINKIKNLRVDWTEELVIDAFRKCSSKTEVSRKYSAAVKFAKKNNLYEKFCELYLNKP